MHNHGPLEPVLVTGASGWLGQRLVNVLAGVTEDPSLRELCRPRAVRCLVLPGESPRIEPRARSRVTVLEGDITDAVDCARFVEGARGGTLFHTAGVIHPARSRQFHTVNVDGTKRLLQAAASAGVRRVVVTSSNSPCGNGSRFGQAFDESSAFNPRLGYGRSKMEMELLVREFHRGGILETVIVRPPWFYGPYQPIRQTALFRMIRDGTVPVVGDGENRRSMVYIDNLCQGMLLAEACPAASGHVYWVADERPYTMNEVIDTVERLLEGDFGIACTRRRVRLPSIVSEVAGVADGVIQALGLYEKRVHVLWEMNKNIECSVAKAKRELGYHPTVALEEGMRRSIAWCVAEGLFRR